MKSHASFRRFRNMMAVIAGGGFGLVSLSAEAYVGPGAGVTMLGALWAVLLAALFALGALFIWPIRALRRRLRQKKAIGESVGDSQIQEP